MQGNLVKRQKARDIAAKVKKGNRDSVKGKRVPMKKKGGKDVSKTGAKRRITEVRWNLDEEIAKVYEKRADLGQNQRVEGGKSWDVDEEVRKVMETGMALGIDFSGREAEVMFYLSSREHEEEENSHE